MSHGLLLQDSPPSSPVAHVVQRDRAEPSLISFVDEEDAFIPTPAVSATNSSNATAGTVRIIRRQCESSTPSSTSASSCATPLTPSLLTHGADMPEDLIAMLDADPMPMLPPSMIDQFHFGLPLAI